MGERRDAARLDLHPCVFPAPVVDGVASRASEGEAASHGGEDAVVHVMAGVDDASVGGAAEEDAGDGDDSWLRRDGFPEAGGRRGYAGVIIHLNILWRKPRSISQVPSVKFDLFRKYLPLRV
jgi:hypothetical protein